MCIISKLMPQETQLDSSIDIDGYALFTGVFESAEVNSIEHSLEE